MRLTTLPVAISALLLVAVEVRADDYTVDLEHSSILFKINHWGVSDTWGRFNEFSGKLTVDGRQPKALEMTVKAETIDTNSKKRDDHLRGPDFFNAEQFPEITFKSKALRKLDGNKYEAKGTLALHGESKEITVPLERIGSGPGMNDHRTGFEAVFTIRRSDFGITFAEGILGEDVRMTVAIEGVRK